MKKHIVRNFEKIHSRFEKMMGTNFRKKFINMKNFQKNRVIILAKFKKILKKKTPFGGQGKTNITRIHRLVRLERNPRYMTSLNGFLILLVVL